MVTVAVAFLLFFRCTLLRKSTGKSSTIANASEDVPDVAAAAKPSEPIANGTIVRKKMENGVFPGIVNGAIPSQTSMEELIANRKKLLQASVGNGCSLNEMPSGDASSSEESESATSRSLAECMSLLKAPVRFADF